MQMYLCRDVESRKNSTRMAHLPTYRGYDCLPLNGIQLPTVCVCASAYANIITRHRRSEMYEMVHRMLDYLADKNRDRKSVVF